MSRAHLGSQSAPRFPERQAILRRVPLDLGRLFCGSCGSVRPLPPVQLTYRLREGEWRLEAPFRCEVGGSRLEVPDGFRFDLASVPRVFWVLVAPFELSLAAPLVHDFLYRWAGVLPRGSVVPWRSFSRAEADRAFCRLMARQGVAGWRLATAYLAVRLAGFLAWRRGGRRLDRSQRVSRPGTAPVAARRPR